MSGKKLHVLIALLMGAGILAASYQVQSALAGAGLLAKAHLVGDVLLAALSASSLFLLLRHWEGRRELLRQQLYEAVSADLNHHIRNALQLIVNRAEMIEAPRLAELRDIREAVSRIDWALREILPRGYESPGQMPTYAQSAAKHLRNPATHHGHGTALEIGNLRSAEQPPERTDSLPEAQTGTYGPTGREGGE